MTHPALLQTRRHCLLRSAGLAFAALSARPSVQAAATALPAAVSLRDELALALEKGNPLLVMVSLEGCPFCKVARENYLIPLHRQQGLSVVQVDMRSQQAVQDFVGVSQTHDSLIRSWGIKMAPTVLFFGPSGAEIAERLVGASSDYYGTYLDNRVSAARALVRVRPNMN